MNEGDLSAGNAISGLTLPIFAAMIDRIATWKIIEGLLFHFDKRRPLMFLLFKIIGLSRLASLTPTRKILDRSFRQMETHLDALEAQLQKTGGPFILGSSYSLADVSWLVIFEWLAQVDCIHVFLANGTRPRCSAYWERLKVRPSYRAAILEQSRATIAYGTERLRPEKAENTALRQALEAPLASRVVPSSRTEKLGRQARSESPEPDPAASPASAHERRVSSTSPTRRNA